MDFLIKKAIREKIFVKIALMSPSGGGKTYSALRLATGMAKQIEKLSNKKAKILLANTEAKRGYYYASEFDYDIVDIEAPHNPEKYVELINFAIKEGYNILIIDSSSHEWEGKGGCLELHQQAGGTYQAWSKVTPRHNQFINTISESPIHIIATMRGKDQYELEKDEKGKASVKKLGIGAKQRDGFEYEFTCSFLIDQKTHTSEPQKDNTHIFDGSVAVLLSEDYGKKIIQWANSGIEYTPSTTKKIEELKKEIICLCNELGGTKNEVLMNILKDTVPNGNPNAIKNFDEATKLLDKLKLIK